MKFKRENRCLVFSRKDCETYLSEAEKEQLNKICFSINSGRFSAGKYELDGVFIKSKWDVYEEAWDLVEKQCRLDKETEK